MAKEAAASRDAGDGVPRRSGPAGETARDGITERNPNVGRKSPVTWLRQHAIVSGIIKHRLYLSVETQHALSQDDPLIYALLTDLPFARIARARVGVSKLVSLPRRVAWPGTTLSTAISMGNSVVALRDRDKRERLLPDDGSYWLYQPQLVRKSRGGKIEKERRGEV